MVDGEGNKTAFQVVLDNGKPLKMDKKYKVAMNNFMYFAFKFNHEDQGASANLSSNEAIVKYLEAHPHIDYAAVSRFHER